MICIPHQILGWTNRHKMGRTRRDGNRNACKVGILEEIT